MDELVAGLKSVRQKLCILNLNSSSSKYLSLPSRHSNTKTFFSDSFVSLAMYSRNTSDAFVSIALP